MNIAVVILNWNGQALLERFLPSVISNSSAANIYVIDNASEDNSVLFLKSNFPGINLVQLESNLGYAGGYNHGLRHIDADIYCLLNNDVRVDKDWLLPVISAFEEDPSLGAAQPTIRDLKNPEQFEYAGAAGGFIDRYGYPFCRGRLFETIEADEGQYDHNNNIFWASGACLFIRKSVFDSSGGFDESFFAHMEEIDFCWRIHNSGFSVKHIPGSKVFHLGGGTLSHSSPRKTFLNFRNSLLMLQKNLPDENRDRIILIRLLIDGLAAVRFLLQFSPKHSLAVFNAHRDFHRKRKDGSYNETRSGKTMDYYHIRSVVWSYFIAGKRVFSHL